MIPTNSEKDQLSWFMSESRNLVERDSSSNRILASRDWKAGDGHGSGETHNTWHGRYGVLFPQKNLLNSAYFKNHKETSRIKVIYLEKSNCM